MGAKCLRANELLPDPEGPIRTTRLGPGARSSPAEHRHLRRRADLGIFGADRQVAHVVADGGRRRRPPRSRTARASTQTDGRDDETGRPAASPSARCTRRWASSRPPCRSRRAEDVLLCGSQARRIEVLDDLDERRGVEADQSLVAVRQRTVKQTDPLALRIVQLVELAVAAPRLLERAHAHIGADDELVVLSRSAAPAGRRARSQGRARDERLTP